MMRPALLMVALFALPAVSADHGGEESSAVNHECLDTAEWWFEVAEGFDGTDREERKEKARAAAIAASYLDAAHAGFDCEAPPSEEPQEFVKDQNVPGLGMLALLGVLGAGAFLLRRGRAS